MAIPTIVAALTVGAFHWKVSGADVNIRWYHLLNILSNETPEEAAQKERIQKNTATLRVSNYILFSQIFIHFVAWKTMWLAFGVLQNPSVANCILLFLHMGLYVQHLLVVKTYIQPTSRQVRVLSAVVYVTYAFGYFVTSFVEHSFPTGSTTLSEKYVLATRFFLVMAFIDMKLSVVCQLVFSLTILGTSWYHGKELGYLQVTDECEIYVCLIVFMVIIEVMMRKRVQACLQSMDAEWMVSGFRRVLRGVCDCEFLLDHELKIRGNSECLQHMLMSDEKLQGMEFTKLLADQQEAFRKFVAMSTRTAKNIKSPADVQTASCMRVSFATKTSQRSADLFHVPMPQPLGEPYHLLAVREDSESPVLEPVNDEGSPGHFGMSPHSERKGTKGYAASDSSVSTVWQPQAVKEILEMMLLVDVDSDGFDVEQLQISFNPSVTSKNDSSDTSKAPRLREMMKAKEWRRVASCLTAFANERSMEAKDPEQMKALRLHLPWSCDEYMTARDVEISHFRSFRSDGQKLCLHLKNFFK